MSLPAENTLANTAAENVYLFTSFLICLTQDSAYLSPHIVHWIVKLPHVCVQYVNVLNVSYNSTCLCKRDLIIIMA